jgi:hypothetical protein
MKYILFLLLLTGCNTFYFSPLNWYDSFESQPETSATQYGDCTTDAQCEELVPEQHFFCYKETSYVGHCAQVME